MYSKNLKSREDKSWKLLNLQAKMKNNYTLPHLAPELTTGNLFQNLFLPELGTTDTSSGNSLFAN
jgi:hypothetical protein